jgi:uncharacterized protein YjdB
VGITDYTIISDVDGDGKPDIITQTPGWGFSIYHNAAPAGMLDSAAFGERVDFSFPDATYTSNSKLKITDIDGDTKPDVVLAIGGYISVMRNTSVPGVITDSSFAAPVTLEMAKWFDIADLDLDGKQDIVFGNSSGLFMMKNISSVGAVAFSVSELISGTVIDYGNRIILGDLNGDNKADILITGGAYTYVYENLSTSSGFAFASPVEVPGNLTKVVIADLDGDNIPDIVGNFGANFVVYKNNAASGSLSASSFSEPVSFEFIHAIWTSFTDFDIADINGDSKPDIVGVGENDDAYISDIGKVSVFLNTTTAGIIDTNSFAKQIPFSINGGYSGLVRVAVGDLDADGKPDLVVSDWWLSILKNIPLVASPTITTVSPVKSVPGTPVTITGTNFNTTADSNVVYFGATKADVSAATTSSLTVTVPLGATYQNITANNRALSLAGHAPYAFLPTFDTAGHLADALNFTFAATFNHTGACYMSTDICDIDGDGKPDIIVAPGCMSVLSIYRNISATGTINDSSFAPKVDFELPTTGWNARIRTADIDGDGKKDIIVGVGEAIYFYRNSATAGSISSSSLSPVVVISGVPHNSLAFDDFDRDGKTDLVVSGSYSLFVWRNTSVKGSISKGSFAAPVVIDVLGGEYGSFYTVETGDIDGDNKPEIAVQVDGATRLFQNFSAPGILHRGSFSEGINLPYVGANFKIADFDGDGKNDIGGTGSVSPGTGMSIIRNISVPGVLSDTSFASRVDCPYPEGFYGGWSSTLADLNGDGRVDMLGTGDDYGIVVAQNRATPGTFTSASFTGTRFGNDRLGNFKQTTSVSSADLDGDGRPEVVVGDFWGGMVVLKNSPLPAHPTTVVSVSPLKGKAGDSVRISGLAFNNSTDSNVVYFGASKATVLSSSDTVLTVSVPTGTTYDNVTANNRASSLTGHARYPFLPTFDTSGLLPGTINFDPVAILSDPLAAAYGRTAVGDIDGDGKPDLVLWNDYSVIVYRNTSVSGSLTEESLAAGVELTVYSPSILQDIYLKDMDGDGKLDIVIANGIILLNTATPGAITASSFAAPEQVTLPGTTTGISDIDNDGRLDWVTVTPYLAVTRNLSTPGNLYFSHQFATAYSEVYYPTVGVVDIDGDGKDDIIASSSTGINVMLKNMSDIGAVSFVDAGQLAPMPDVSEISTADLDGDGKNDVIIRNTDGNCAIYRNTAIPGVVDSSSFATPINFMFPGRALCMADFDGDGKVDIARIWVGEGFNTIVRTYRNTAVPGAIDASSFTDSTTFFIAAGGPYIFEDGLKAADLDCDGKADLVLHQPGYIAMLRNDPLAHIAGPNAICLGAAATYTNTTTGGTWSINDTSVATIDSAGNVTAIASGSTTITYSFLSGGEVTKTIAVVATPAAITGASDVCVAATITLANTTSGGTWGSSSPSVAVGPATGAVTGIESGTATINYTVGGGCTVSYTITVNAVPGAGVITGDSTLCVGGLATLSNSTTSGTWSSSNTGVATVNTTGVVSGLVAGSVNISYTVTNGCGSASVIKTMSVMPLPNAGTISGTLTTCTGGTTTLSNTASGGTWGSSNTAVATVGSTGIVLGLATGTATISYTVSNSCGSTSAADVITVLSTPAAGTITGPSSVTAGAAITLSNTVSGGTWGASNTNASVSSAGVVTGISAGTVTISYTVANACGTATVTKVLTVNVPIEGATEVCVGSTTSLGATPGGTWSSSNGARASVSAAGVVTGISAGTVNITYTLGTGISITPITINPIPAGITGTPSLCNGATTTLSNTTTGGAWSSLSTSVATINSAGIVVGVGAGTSLVKYTLPTGCATSAIVTVNASPATITGTFNVCVGATVSLSNATSGGTWGSSAPTTANVATTGVVTGMAAGTANITYTMAGGCKAYAMVTVYANPAAIGGPTTSACVGATFTLTETTTGGTWGSANSTIATVGSTGVVTGIAAGTTQISYTMPAGCYAVKVVTVKPNPADITGTKSLCAGATTSLTSATGGGVSWATSNATVANVNVSSGVVTGVGAGTAGITYTIGNGCKTSAVVTVNPQPATIGGTAKMCAGAGTTLTNTVSGGSWVSSNTTVATIGSATGVVTGLSAGTSVITYTLGTGCSKTVIVTVNPIPASIAGTAATCIGSTTTLTNTTAGGTWSSGTPAVATIGVSTGVIAGVAAGTSLITYKLSTGCQATTVATVNTLTTAIGGTLSVCPGNTASLTNATTGGTWSSGSPTVASIGSISGVVTGVNPGTTIITYTAGCKTTAVVTVSALPAAITGTMSACAGASTTLSSTTTGGTWGTLGASVVSVGATTGIVAGITAGTATVTYSLGSGCLRSAVVTIYPTPAAITGSTNICSGSVSTLSSTMAGGTWYSSLTPVATIGGSTGIVAGGSAGVATITYTLGAGCQVTTPVTVNALPGDVAGTKSACIGNTTTLSSTTTGGSWSSINTTIATIDVTSGVVAGIATGTSLISYTLPTGCAKTAVVTINASPAAIGGAGAICAGASATLTDATTGGTWASSDVAIASVNTAGIVTGNAAGVATITYTIGTGCRATADVTVNQLPSTISGTASVCEGVATTLTNTVSGGIWNSGNTAVATVGSSTGVITGLTAGTSIITYTLPTGCSRAAVVTVNALPAAISGTSPICAGSSATFTDATTGGTWSSSDAAVASVNALTGVVTGNAAGVATITYTTTGGCSSTTAVSILAAPAAISGTLTVCTGATTLLTNATTGGAWASGNIAKATVDGSTGIVTGITAGTAAISYNAGGGCYAIAIVTVSAMPSISGNQTVCVNLTTTLSGSPAGGTWSTASSLASVNAPSGVVTAGSTAGVAAISYTSAGCTVTAVVTVASVPAAISGVSTICRDQTTTFTNAVSGGTWISNNTAAAIVDATTGVITGMAAGMSSVITYTFGGSCWAVKGVTVNVTPAATTGYQAACVGLTTQFLNAAGGVWTSSNTGIATVNVGSGIVTGVAPGTATITYDKSGCFVTRIVTVIASPGTITGTLLMCTSTATTLSNAVAGGTWSSGNTAIANVGSATGIVTSGTLANVSTISYNFGANCRATAIVTVRAIPNVISGPATMCVTVNSVYTSSTTGGTWSSSNSAIANVVSGSAATSATFAGVAPGTATISYTNAPSCTRTLVVAVNACGRAAGGTTGIQQPIADSRMNVSVYPNPTRGKFTLETTEHGKFAIYTLDGKQVAGYEITGNSTVIELPKTFATGVYMCRFIGEDGSAVMVRLILE